MLKICAAIIVILLSVAAAAPASAVGVDVENKTITVSVYQEPKILDSMSVSTVEFTAEVLAHIQEGLMRLDARRRVVGGVAESWEMTPKQLRFRLRKDAKWQNGEPVTAADFVYAWRTLVSPETGSQSANLASPIVNALAILRGEKPTESLGVRAVSQRELEIDLTHPCNWCLKLMTSSAFYPVNQKFHEGAGEAFGTSPSTHLSNGAFLLEDWQRGKQFTLARNPVYWANERIHLNKIHYGFIASDAKTSFNLYRSGELAVIRLNRDTLSEGTKLRQRIRVAPTGYLMHLQFSHKEGMLSANENLRKAIALVVDKNDLVNRVLAIPGTRVSDSMFHDWMAVGEKKRGAVLQPKAHEPDIEMAKIYVQKAKAELGITGRPTITFTIFDSTDSGRIAEYLQQRLALIDVDLKIDPQTVQMLLDKWFKGTTDIALIGWIPDVDDPIDQLSFLGNPDIRSVFQGLYPGSDMSEIYYTYRDATSDEQRLAVVKQAQAFFENRVTVLPLYESYSSTLIDPRLRGYVFQPVRAFSDYRNVRIVDVND